jgi:hypothetical protein
MAGHGQTPTYKIPPLNTVPRSPFLRRTIFRPALLILGKIVTIIALVGLGLHSCCGSCLLLFSRPGGVACDDPPAGPVGCAMGTA